MTATNPAALALRRLMAPWIEHAKRNIHLPITASARASDIAKDLWIHWNLPPTATMSALDVETMELLELYARVDYREAWTAIVRAADKSMLLEELLGNLCGTKSDSDEDEETRLLYPRFTIYGLEDAMYNDHFRDTAKWLVLRVDPRDHSHTYYTTRETLLQCWADSHGAAFQRTALTRIPLQLNVDLRGDDDRDGGDRLLKEFATIASLTHDPARLREAQPEWNQRRTHCGLSVPVSDLFTIACVDADFNSIAITDAMLISTQEMMVDSRVQIANLTLDRAGYEMAELTPQVTTPFFRTMLLPVPMPSTSTAQATTTSGSSIRKLQPTSVELQCDVRFDVFQGVGSALLASPSVRELSIHFPEIDSHEEKESDAKDDSEDEKDEDENEEEEEEDEAIDFFEGEDHHLFWSWVAYALFSGEATHTIEDLSLRAFVLTESHVRVVKRVLRARDPLAYIAAVRKGPYKLPRLPTRRLDSEMRQTRATREPTVVDVSPGATLWLDKYGCDTIQTSDQTVEMLRVVEDDDVTNRTRVSVVYPGAGVCWVDRSDIVARRVFSSAGTALSLRKLAIQITDNTSMTALVQLLALVGGTVETLTLHALCAVGVHDDDLRQLVAACPKLRHLDLGYLVMMDFAWLQGSELESLALSGVICARTSAYPRLLAALATTDTALQLDLRELRIQREALFLEQIAPRLVRMLDTNRRLERVFLSADTQEGNGEEASPRLVNAMKKRNGVALHVRKTPLPLRCTLALLSVMRASGDDHQDLEHDDNDSRHRKRQCQQRQLRVLPALHAPLVAIIAAFAAPHKHRVCGVVPFHKIW